MSNNVRRRGAQLGVAVACVLLACNDTSTDAVDESETWVGRGVVRGFAPGGRQILIEHEDIPDLMPAMTMNFDVLDAAAASRLRSGQDVEFTLEYTMQGLRISSIRPVGAAVDDSAAASSGFSGLIEVGAAAPDFSLVDQAGEAFALRDLSGRVVVLDFIFTNCPGPCPIQTATHVGLQRLLEAGQRERTRFVSISLDPTRDTPEALRSYAERLGVELEGWSFVTGREDEVAAVIESYGVGTVVSEGGEIDHMLVTYLIDPEGRIAERYLGSSHGAEAMLRDIRSALSLPAVEAPRDASD
jgi:protein SCO1/2